MVRFTLRSRLAVVLVLLVAVACGGTNEFSSDEGSASDAAIALIEGSGLAQRLGIGPMSGASCDEPESEQVGEVFACRAESDDRLVELEIMIDGADSIFASPLNVVTRAVVEDYASDAVRLLNQENNFDFPTDALDCGTSGVVLDESRQMHCVLTDPESGIQFDTSVRVNPQTAQISVVVGEPLDG